MPGKAVLDRAPGAGGYCPRKAAILLNIYQVLLRRYGPQHWWPAQAPFEVCVGAILVQNTNWNNAAKAILNCERAGGLSFSSMNALTDERLRELIRPAGFFNVKAKRLRAFLDFLSQRCAGRVEVLADTPWPAARTELLSVNGIGPETADSILLYALSKPVFVVDAYTRRMLQAQGFAAHTADYHVMQALFMDNLPLDAAVYNEYHALIVAMGKEHGFLLGTGPDLFYNEKNE